MRNHRLAVTSANRAQIEASMAGPTIDVVKRTLDAVTAVELDLLGK